MNTSFFDSATYIPAPLKTLNQTAIANANRMLSNSGVVCFNSLEPYLYNKVGFLQNADLRGNSVITDVGGGLLGSYHCTLAGLQYDSPEARTFTSVDMGDFTCLITVEKISAVVPSTKLIYEMGTYNLGLPVNQQLTPGAYGDCISRTYFVNPSDGTQGYSDWYYIKNVEWFTRTDGAQTARQQIYNIYPFVPFVGSTLQYSPEAGLFAYKTVDKKSGTYACALQLCFDVRNSGGQCQPLSSLFLNVFAQRTSQSARNDVQGTPRYIHQSLMGENIKLIGSGTDIFTTRFTLLQTPNSIKFCGTPENVFVAFKTTDDILALFADWGINTATFDREMAINADRDLFPNPPSVNGDTNIPQGADGKTPPISGYPTNPIIPFLPNYPDNTSDIIPEITPNISTLNTGGAYALNLTSLKTLFSWLMTSNYTQNISELFNDKISALNDIKLYPFDIVAHDTLHAEKRDKVIIGNVPSDLLDCYAILPNYNTWLNGGTIHYLPYYGNYNDYVNCSYHIFIPYAGIVDLPPSTVINTELSVRYAMDLITGNATVIIKSNDVIIKMLPAHLSQSIPIIFTNTNQQQINNALTALNIVNNIIGGATNLATGNYIGAFGNALGGMSAGISSALTNPLKYGHIGTFGQGTSMSLSQRAFLIITRTQIAPYNSNYAIGTPASFYGKLSAFTGSGLIKAKTNIINTTATDEEKREIFTMLNNGIII